MYICTNTRCPLRYACILVDEDDTYPVCPECGSPLTQEEDSEDGCLPPPRANQPRGVTAVAISAIPYGGYELTFDDDDGTHTFGGEVRQDTGSYVRELKLDLLRLGYYGPWRFQSEPEAHFNWHLVGSVLAFKHDLVNHYNVNADPNHTRERPTPDNLQAEGPVLYSTSLRNPFRERSELTSRCSHLRGTLRNHTINLDNSLAQLTRQLQQEIRRLGSGNPDRLLRARATSPVRVMVNRINPVITSVNQLLRHAGLRSLSPTEPDYENEIDQLLDSSSAADSSLPEQSDLASMREDAQVSEVTLNDAVPESVRTHLSNLMSFLNQKLGVVKSLDRDDTSGGNWIRADLSRLRAVQPPVGEDVVQNRIDHLSRIVQLRDSIYTCLRKVQILAGRCNSYFQSSVEEQRTEYENNLKRYGTVDWSTALYIKQMALNSTLSGRGVYRVPINDEITEVTDRVFNQIIRSIAPGVTSSSGDHVPEPLILAIMGHESGASHTSRGITGHPFGFKIVLFGVDWNNNGRRHIFEIERTQSGPWVHSRGWGGSQFTTFDSAIESVTHHDGLPFTDESTPPNVRYISESEENIRIGINLYKNKFDDATRESRRCSFTPRYDCYECLRRFRRSDLVPVGRGASLGVMGSATSFALLRNSVDVTVTSTREYDVTGSTVASSIAGTKPFLPAVAQAVLDAQVHIATSQRTLIERILSHRVNDRRRRRGANLFAGLPDLFQQIAGEEESAEGAEVDLTSNLRLTFERRRDTLQISRIRAEVITGQTPAAPFFPAEFTEYAIEYPCSWLAAVIRYGGSGQQAYQALIKHSGSVRRTWVLSNVTYQSDFNDFRTGVLSAMQQLPTTGANAIPVESSDLNGLVAQSRLNRVHRELSRLDPAPAGGSDLELAVKFSPRRRPPIEFLT